MVPTIKRILYATDLSETAKYAFGFAADMAQRYDARLTVLSVIEALSPFAESHIREMIGKSEWERVKSEHSKSSREKIKERVAEFCRQMDENIDSCSIMVDDIRVPKGVPHLEILKTAKEVNADMIVMGTYGHNIIQDSLIGGTARRIVKDSKIPVMVIRLPQADA